MFRRLVQHNLVKRGQRYFSNDVKIPTMIVPPSSPSTEEMGATWQEVFGLLGAVGCTFYAINAWTKMKDAQELKRLE